MGRQYLKFSFFAFLALSFIAASPSVYSQENSSASSLMGQFFTEQTLTVTNEGDGFVPGTLRTVLLQAAGIRKNNPFALVKINFDPNVRSARIVKGPLRMEGGLIQIDCAGKATIDGSLFDTRYLDEKEISAGILIRSSGNSIRGCKIYGFPGKNILIAGNRNQIRENIIGVSSGAKPNNPYSALASAVDESKLPSNTGIYLDDHSSENLIESNNILGHKTEGIAFSNLAGTGNKIVGNAFSENAAKSIHSAENQYRSYKPLLKSITREGDAFVLTGTLSEPGEVEIYLAGPSGREGKMPITPPTLANRGDFALSIKNKGFVPGVTKLVALVSSLGKNTSEFSEPALIPLEAPRHELIPQSPPPPPAETSNPAIPMETGSALPTPSPNVNPASGAVPNIAPAIDPFLNSNTLPPLPLPQVVEPPQNGLGPKSSNSDSVKTESTFVINGGI